MATVQPLIYTDGPTLGELVTLAFECIQNENVWYAADHFCCALPIILTTPVSAWDPNTIWAMYEVSITLLGDAEVEAAFQNKSFDSLHPVKMLYSEMLCKLLLLVTHQLAYATDDELSFIKAYDEESDHNSIKEQIDILHERKAYLNSLMN